MKLTNQAKVGAAFDSCACGLQVDACQFDFQNVTGILAAWARKEVNPANNECLEASVDLGTGTLLSCMPEPCAVE